eukprot:jgi/Mesvir1/22484/Mv04292-RA.1
MARKTPNAAATDAAPSNPTCDDEPMVDTNVLVDSKRRNGRDGLFRPSPEEIPTWNQDIIEEETKQVSQTMPYLKELLKAYFVCTSMILASIRMSKNKNDKMKVKVPAPERFVHMVLKGVALDVVDDLDHFVDALEDGTFKLKRRAVLKSVSESVKNALHRLMPIDDILKEYMGDILSKDSFKSGGAASCADGGGAGLRAG